MEVLLFTLQSRMRAANQKPYTPREGKMIHDINRAWERLEKAEHERELALREELIRQEKLEQLAARYVTLCHFMAFSLMVAAKVHLLLRFL